MELFEKINRSFGSWYENLFGGTDDVRPKDILRKILTALDENRKEGFDSKVYVPNQFILEIAVDDEEEKEYLLSFLDRDELETAIRRYCQQNHYHIRGSLDFTIKEVEADSQARRRDKVRVRCRYDSKLAAEKPAPTSVPPQPEDPRERIPRRPGGHDEENPTVYEVVPDDDSDTGTVPAVALARLTIHSPDRAAYDVSIARGALTIGRSARAGNDVVLAEDGMVSRRHARIELDADGQFTLYDLDTTNGTRVNGRKVDNRALKSGDEIMIGATKIVFHQEETGRVESRESRVESQNPEHLNTGRTPGSPQHLNTRTPEHLNTAASARLILLDGFEEVDDFVLASETLIGRGLTNHIVLSDRSVATRHARLMCGNPCTVEALDAESRTLVNGVPLKPGIPAPLRSGDRIGIGTLVLRFEEGRQ